jgi:hypothetical protein
MYYSINVAYSLIDNSYSTMIIDNEVFDNYNPGAFVVKPYKYKILK